MIDSQALRRAAAAIPVLVVDHQGHPMELDGIPSALPVPGLVVRVVTEAVKRVEGGRLVGDVDREGLWAVLGFILDEDVVSGLDAPTYTTAELIRAVESAGYRWQPTLL